MQSAKCKFQNGASGRSGIFQFALFIFHFALVCSLVSPLHAGKFNKAVSPGDVGKPFAGLMGTNDKPHSLADYLSGGKGVVLLFTCNHCPVASAYEERLLAIAREFEPQGVKFVAVSCGKGEADELPAMKERAAAKKYPFPYLHDPSQQSGRDYGARVTPEVFVMQPNGKIIYLGTVDDSWNDATQVKHRYLRDALEALVAGHEPETQETRPRGCPIPYED